MIKKQRFSKILKTTHTRKGLIGISPTGIWLIFSETYSGSMSVSNIGKKSDLIRWVKEED